jgi:hypothetical protein
MNDLIEDILNRLEKDWGLGDIPLDWAIHEAVADVIRERWKKRLEEKAWSIGACTGCWKWKDMNIGKTHLLAIGTDATHNATITYLPIKLFTVRCVVTGPNGFKTSAVFDDIPVAKRWAEKQKSVIPYVESK